MRLKIQQRGAKIIFSLCMFIIIVPCWAQQNSLNFFLPSRNCSNCIYYSKLLYNIPYFIPSNIITDVPLNTDEFSFLIDSMLELERSKYEFEYKKEIPLSLFNQVQITNPQGEVLYQNSILAILDDLDSILGFWNNHMVISYKIKSKFPMFNSIKVIPNEDGSIFCYSYTADKLLHINLQTKKEFEYTPKQVNLSDVYRTIYNDSAKANNAYSIITNSEQIFKRIQIDHFLSDNDTAYLLFRVKVPFLVSADSIKSKYEYKSKYVVGTFYAGRLLELSAIKGLLPMDSSSLDEESYFIQSMAIVGGIFKMEHNKSLIIGVSKATYTSHKQKYFIRFEKRGNRYEYSNVQTTISNNHLIAASRLLSKEAMDDYNFSNYPSLTKDYIYFYRQTMLYNIKSKSWLSLKFNRPQFDTLIIKQKNFINLTVVMPNAIKTLNYFKNNEYSGFALNTFDKKGYFVDTDTIILDSKSIFSTPYLTTEGVIVMDNQGVIRIYKYNYIPMLRERSRKLLVD